MSDWSKDLDLEVIKDYLKECAENDDYHYEQYQVDIVMHEYIRQKQVIEAITSENERLHSIIKEVRKYITDIQDRECEQSGAFNVFPEFIRINAEKLLEILGRENND